MLQTKHWKKIVEKHFKVLYSVMHNNERISAHRDFIKACGKKTGLMSNVAFLLLCIFNFKFLS